jgi:plasmid maintenance system killer protein
VRISFIDKKIEALCRDGKVAKKRLGAPAAKKLFLTLMELTATDTVQNVSLGKPHTLKGSRAEQMSLRLSDKCRIVFIATPPKPEKQDGTTDWGKVMDVTIIEIGDYHDE